MLDKIWSVIEKNRWTVIIPIIAVIVWLAAGISCTPITKSPARPTVMVNAIELQQDYELWLADCNAMSKKFEWAAKDIQRQAEQWSKIEATIMQVASGNVANWSGLVSLLMGSGIIGLFADNIRKNGVIGGLKINKTPS